MPTPTPLRSVLHDPDYQRSATPGEIAELADESGEPPTDDPAAVGWDLSMGCRINAGRDPDGHLRIEVMLGCDYDGSGKVRRTCTQEQLVMHAWHLLLLAQDEIAREPNGHGNLGGELARVTSCLAELLAASSVEIRRHDNQEGK